jgi:hypothetical protein
MSSYLGIDGKWHGGSPPNQDDAILAGILRRAIAGKNIELQGMALMGIGPPAGPAREDGYLTTLTDTEAHAIERAMEDQ